MINSVHTFKGPLRSPLENVWGVDTRPTCFSSAWARQGSAEYFGAPARWTPRTFYGQLCTYTYLYNVTKPPQHQKTFLFPNLRWTQACRVVFLAICWQAHPSSLPCFLLSFMVTYHVLQKRENIYASNKISPWLYYISAMLWMGLTQRKSRKLPSFLDIFCPTPTPGSVEVLLKRTWWCGKERENFAQASQACQVTSLFFSVLTG